MGNPNHSASLKNEMPNETISLESLSAQAKGIELNDSSLSSLTDNLKRIFECEAATLFAYDRSTRELYSRNFRTQGIEEIRVDISVNNLAGFVAATGKPLNIRDVHSKEELSRYHQDLSYDDVWDRKINFVTKSMMIIPLPHQNKLVGVMEIINKHDGEPFLEEDFAKAKAISSVMGLALVRLEQQESKNNQMMKQTLDREDKLRHLSHAIHSAQSLDEVLFDLQGPLMEVFDSRAVTIYVADSKGLEISSKIPSKGQAVPIRLPVDPTSIAGFSAAEQRLVNIRNVHDAGELQKFHPDLEFDSSWDDHTGLKTRSLLAISLTHKNKLMGVLQLVNKADEDGFTAADENNAFLIAETLALAIHNLRKFTQAQPTKFDFLIENGFLTEEELTLTMAKSRKTGKEVEDLLVKDLYLRSLDIGKSLEKFYKVPYTGYDESISLPDPESLGLNIETLLSQNWVPLKYDDSGMVVLIHDPSDDKRVHDIQSMFPRQHIEFRVGLKADIHRYIHSFFGVQENEDSVEEENATSNREEELVNEEYDLVVDLEEKEIEAEPEPEQDQDATPPRETSIAKATIKLFNDMIGISAKQEVTDIHIEPGMEGKDTIVRLRKDGACRVFDEIPSAFQRSLISHIKKLANLDLSVTKLPQNGKFEWTDKNCKFLCEAVIFPTIGDLEDAMLKITPLGKPLPTYMPLSQLNFSDPNLDKILSRIASPKGLVLVSGPAGKGKTTTLHSLLGQINSDEKKIVTAEDPVEIVQSGLRQIQVNNEVGLNYACALDTFLMGNPDVIAIGQIDSEETLGECLRAGKDHLVATTLNANSCIDALRTLREMKVDQNQLADSLLLIVSQKLVPSLCEHCKEDYHPTQEEFDTLKKFYGELYFPELGIQYNEDLRLKKAVGCKKCIFTGYSDQIALQEVLERTPELNRMIAGKASIEEIRNQAIKDGMVTLNQDGIYKIFNGICDFKKIQEAFLPSV